MTHTLERADRYGLRAAVRVAEDLIRIDVAARDGDDPVALFKEWDATVSDWLAGIDDDETAERLDLLVRALVGIGAVAVRDLRERQ